jgi:hypothetical protein
MPEHMLAHDKDEALLVIVGSARISSICAVRRRSQSARPGPFPLIT